MQFAGGSDAASRMHRSFGAKHAPQDDNESDLMQITHKNKRQALGKSLPDEVLRLIYWPVPLNETACGPVTSLSPMFMVADWAPVTVGANWTLIVQLELAATVPFCLP